MVRRWRPSEFRCFPIPQISLLYRYGSGALPGGAQPLSGQTERRDDLAAGKMCSRLYPIAEAACSDSKTCILGENEGFTSSISTSSSAIGARRGDLLLGGYNGRTDMFLAPGGGTRSSGFALLSPSCSYAGESGREFVSDLSSLSPLALMTCGRVMQEPLGAKFKVYRSLLNFRWEGKEVEDKGKVTRPSPFPGVFQSRS